MSDLQAIDLLKGLEQSLDDYCELNDEGKTAFGMAIAALELFGNSEPLPSAQPEIIRCKDCKYAEYIDDVKTLWCTECGQGRTVAPNDFCSYAERREVTT